MIPSDDSSRTGRWFLLIILGYIAYIGYLLLEHQHANPVLQVFVRLLVEDCEIKKKDRYSKAHEVDLEEACKFIVTSTLEIISKFCKQI